MRIKVKKAKGNNSFIHWVVFICAVLAAVYWVNTSSQDLEDATASLIAHAPRGVDDDYSHPEGNTTFPIAELANCASESECRDFCKDEKNMLACVNFAEKHGLMSRQDAAKARKMAELGVTKGPGGCSSASSCEAFCSNVKNIRECVAFAKKNNMMDKDEVAEAEKVIAALDKGAKLPGGCISKVSCEAYCAKPQNIRQCADFAEAAGFVNAKEAAMIRKTGGVGPGGCFGKVACESFCMKPDHMEECIDFATKHDLMPPGEKEEATKVLQALKKGVKFPGECTGKAACEAYCRNPQNMNECFAFAEAAGFIPPEEAKFIRKIMEKGITSGPGGCMSNESCEAYCKQPVHMLQCLAFMKKAGLSLEDLPKGFGLPDDLEDFEADEDRQ